jgi:malonyl-CoA O-methyltransferase
MSDPRATGGFELDRRALARSFDRAASSYDAAASLQQQVRDELRSRLEYFALEPAWILDLGAGTGAGARALRQRYPRARVLAIDIAPGMVRAVPRRPWPWSAPRIQALCADAYALPLADHSINLVFSNLMLQWCDRPEAVLGELARVMVPGGLLLFSSFGPATLGELRAAWSAADDGVHVSDFPSMQRLAEAAMQAGLEPPVLDTETHLLHYADAHALMRSLRQLGARNAARARARGVTSPRRLQAMIRAYEGARTARGLPASYEVLYGAAFAPSADAHTMRRAASAQRGEQVVALSALKARRP